MRIVVLMLLVGLPLSGQAAVYKWVDPATGNVVYSDQPRQGAEKLELPQVQTYHASPVPSQPPDEGANHAAQAEPAYTQFAIVSPTNEKTIRNTAGVVDMTVAVKPPLDVRDGHRISVVLDDKREYGPTKNLHFSLKNVERGTHTLQAFIKDKDGQVLATSDVVTVFVKQHSRLQPKPKL